MEFAFAPDKYSAAVVNLTRNVLIFEFKAVKNDDVGLAKMASYLNTGVQTSQGSENPISPWYKKDDIKKYLTHKLSQFSSFAKANADDEDWSFIVADTSENQTPSEKAVALVSYIMGQCDQEDFEPPSPPGLPQVSNMTHDSIDLVWEKPQCASDLIVSYKVTYSTKQGQLKSLIVSGEKITINELKPNSYYTFKVQAVGNIGVSGESESVELKTPELPTQMSMPITSNSHQSQLNVIHTNAPVSSGPGQPYFANVSDTSIELKWNKPQDHPESVTSYEVLCCHVDDNHIVHKQTNGVVETQIIDELKPETKYSFTVKAVCDAGLSCESETSEITVTKPPLSSAPGQPNMVKVTDTLIELKWSKPENHPESVTSYEVICCHVDDNHIVHKQTNSVVETQIIDELKPETKYSFTVKAMCDAGLSCESETSEITATKLPLSSAPGQPNIVKVTDTLIELKWSKPENHPESVTSYEVICCHVDDNHIVHKQTNGVVETQIIDELKPETKYSFTVKAICDAGLSCESETSEITATKLPLSSAPGQPNIVKVTDTLIELKWSKPENHPESVTSYEVICCHVDDNHIVHKQTNGVVETQIIDELKPETKYSFTVKAICDAGLSCESETSEITVTKPPLSSAPGQPNIVKVTDTLIELKWSKPENHPESVTSYEVICCHVDDNHIVHKQTNGVVETQIIDELKPETKYSFTVKAICDAGLSCESETSEITVTKPPLSSAPGQPNIVKVTDTLIELKWSKPENHPESVTSYEVICCHVDDNHIVHKQTNGVVETQIIDELKPETKYSFTVKAICDAGLSCESETSEITATKLPLSSAPGQPNIVKVTDTLIELKWSKPENHPESVTSYEVICCHVHDNHIVHKQTNGVVETQIIDELKPETKYSFTVKAICDAGLSCESETSEITVTKPPLSSAPGQPNIVKVTDTLIELKWSKPQNHPESVTSYEVFCCHVHDNHIVHNKQTNGVVETQIIDELKPETKYSFTVKAICDAGLSCESETSEITVTKPPLSSAPGQPKVTDTLIELKWSKPENHPESVTSYEVFCCHVHDNHIVHNKQTNGVVETQIIDELKPETKYSFTVKAVCDAGLSCESETSEITATKLPLSSAPGQPNIVKVTDTLIELKWSKPENHPESVTSYEVFCCHVDDNHIVHRQTNGVVETQLINELKPETKYSFTVKAICDAGLSCESQTSDITVTKAPLSSKPGQPNIVRVTDTLIELKWSKPQNHPESVTSYEVFYCRVDDNHIVHRQTNGVVEIQLINELKPETKYSFTVKAICDAGLSCESETSEITVTKPPLSSAPGQPNIVKVTDTLIELKWSKPENHPESVTSYEVFCCHVHDNHIVHNKQTNGVVETQIIDELKPETKYSFTVKAICDAGLSCESETSEITATKPPLSSAPGQPNIVKVTDTLIELKWSKPENHPESVTSYEVFCCRVDDNHIVHRQTNGVVETQIIDELKPETKYSFTVKAVCDAGLSCESETSEITATKPPLSSAPGQPNIVKVTDTLIELKWSKPENHPESVTSYEVFCCRVDDNHIVHRQTNGVVETQLINELKPETKYSFTVKAICDAGLSCESQTSDITVTKAPLSSKPGQPNIVRVTDTLIELKWSKPQNHPESVTSYEVFYCRVDDNHIVHRQTNGVVEIQLINELKPETKYSFTVKAICDAGLSCESETSEITVTKPPLSSAPGQPNIVKVTDTLIELKWSKPENHPESVTSYEVFCCHVHDNHIVHNKQTNGVVETQIIDELKPETKYSFTVKAICDAGLSCESETSEITATKPPLSSAPGQPNIVKVTDTLIELKWSKPENHPESVTSYEVFCCRVDDNHIVHRQTNGVVETQLINELKPETKYSFTVKAVCDAGLSCESQTSDITVTKAPLSSIPGQPNIVRVTDTLIELKWSKPQNHPESVTSYEVFYCRVDDNHIVHRQTNGVVEIQLINELKPETKYSFTVKAICDAGDSPMSAESKIIMTEPPLSSEPGIPVTINISHNSVELEWTKPQKHASSVLFYTVYCLCLDEQSDVWKPYHTDNIKERMFVDGLKPKGNYRFKVQANCRAGKSAESMKTCVISTKLPVSGPPGIPCCCNASSNTIEVKWSKPDKNPEYVEKYQVFYLPENDRTSKWKFKQTDGIEEHITIDKLHPNTFYLFKVKAECNGELSEESEVSESIKTKLPLPGAPGQPTALDVTHDSIKLGWSKPKNHSHIKSYRVSYQSKTVGTDTWTTYDTKDAAVNSVIQNLSPKTTYVFKVQAQTLDCQFGNESTEYIVMTIAIVSSPPGQPIVDNISHDSVRLRWTKPRKHIEAIKGYVVGYCSLDFLDAWQYYQEITKEEETVIIGLTPNSRYCFAVQAECEDGLSEKSIISRTIKTLIPIPSPPGQPKCLSVTEKSVTLQWAAQYAQHVNKYSVDVCSQPNNWITFQNTTEQETITITDLCPKTSYIFRLQAHNNRGSSEKSEVSEAISTRAALPSQPGQPRAIKVTHDQITITWAKPDHYTENVQSYTVLYSSEGKRWAEVKTERTEQECRVSTLSPDTSYYFKVQAESEDGVSKDSDISDVIKTRSPIPSQPGKPKCDSAEHDCITLTWSKPDNYYENVEYYEVSYYSDDDFWKHRLWPWNIAKTTEGAVEKIVVNRLNSKKSYYFKVRAKSKFGDGPESFVSDLIGTKPFHLAVEIINMPQCIRIHDSPVIYRVPMREVFRIDKQKLARQEFGKISHGKHKVLMVVGATGAGKTTLINGMINYLFGVEWKNEFRLNLIEEDQQSQIKSKTKFITAYSFPKQNGFKFPHSLTIVDTPGFGDTEGVQRDQEITYQIKEFFSTSGPNGIDHLDGIGFVAMAGLGRLTPTQNYIFNSILSVFGKDVKDNIFIMTTFADGAKPPLIGAIDAAEIPYKEIFKFNNSALYAQPSNDKIDELFWEMGAINFKAFFDHLSEVKSVSIQLTQEVLAHRELLENIVIGIQKQIKLGMSKIDSLKQEQKVLEDNEVKIKANEDFTYVVEEAQIEEIALQTGEHVTNCLKCNFTCHYPCYIPDDREKYQCAAMKNQEDNNTTCEVCPGKCAWQQHRNMPYRLEINKVMVTKPYSELKERYDQAVEGKTQQESMITNIQKEIQDIFNVILQNIQKAHRCTQRLDEIALKPNPLTDVEYIDLLIESEKQERKADYRKRIAYYQEVKTRAEVIRNTSGQLPQELSAEEAEKWWKKLLSLDPSEEIDVPFPKEIIPTTQPTVDAPLEENATQQSWGLAKAVKSGFKWLRGK